MSGKTQNTNTVELNSIEDIRAAVTPVFKKHNIEGAYLIGSFARGEQTDKSDIDFVFTTDNFYFIELWDDLETRLGRKAGLLNENTLRKSKSPIAQKVFERYMKERVYIHV